MPLWFSTIKLNKTAFNLLIYPFSWQKITLELCPSRPVTNWWDGQWHPKNQFRIDCLRGSSLIQFNFGIPSYSNLNSKHKDTLDRLLKLAIKRSGKDFSLSRPYLPESQILLYYFSFQNLYDLKSVDYCTYRSIQVNFGNFWQIEVTIHYVEVTLQGFSRFSL